VHEAGNCAAGKFGVNRVLERPDGPHPAISRAKVVSRELQPARHGGFLPSERLLIGPEDIPLRDADKSIDGTSRDPQPAKRLASTIAPER
jgi:hypothetical protein